MLQGQALGAALKEAMARKGVTQAQVAAEFGIAQSSVSEWIKFGRVAKKHLTHLVDFFGTHVPPQHWGLPPTWGIASTLGGAGEARSMSLHAFTLPALVTWERVMQSEELPAQFVLEVPDGALGQKLPQGTRVVVERADAAAPGECVLVADKRGGRYIRRYVQAPGGEFEAQALDDAYVSLHSARDGLQVLAVMVWRAERRV